MLRVLTHIIKTWQSRSDGPLTNVEGIKRTCDDIFKPTLPFLIYTNYLQYIRFSSALLREVPTFRPSEWLLKPKNSPRALVKWKAKRYRGYFFGAK